MRLIWSQDVTHCRRMTGLSLLSHCPDQYLCAGLPYIHWALPRVRTLIVSDTSVIDKPVKILNILIAVKTPPIVICEIHYFPFIHDRTVVDTAEKRLPS